jgi:uncharacterized protein YaeQ
MALTATMYHVLVDLSDVDRGVYEALDLRVAQHPSESMRYLLTRVIAYCLLYEEGISFSKGLSSTDEPALWIHDLQGILRSWIDVGTPSPERLHKASKASPRVVIFTQNDPELLKKSVRGKTIHKASRIEVYALGGAFLDELAEAFERNTRWELVHTEGQLYVTVSGKSIGGTVTRHGLVDET